MKMVRHNHSVDQSSETTYMISNTGAGEYVVKDIKLLVKMTEINKVVVKLADGSKTISMHKESVSIDIGVMTVTSRTLNCILSLKMNLLSCSRLVKHGISTSLSGKIQTLIHSQDNDKCLGVILRRTSYIMHV